MKRYLNQANAADQCIRTKLKQLERLRQMVPEPKGFDRTARAIAALQEEIDRDMEDMITGKRRILAQIGRLSRPEYRTLLELHYLHGWPLKSVSRSMHYRTNYTYKLHERAIREFSEVLKSENREKERKKKEGADLL